MKNQIQRDLDRQSSERLQRWMTDSMEMYRIGRVDQDEAFVHLVYCLLMAAISIMLNRHVTRNGAMQTIAKLYDDVAPGYAKMVKEEEKKRHEH